MSEYFKLKRSEVQSIDTICYLPVDLVSYVLYLYTLLKWKIIYQHLLALFNMFYGANDWANAALIDLNTSLRIHNSMFSEGLL